METAKKGSKQFNQIKWCIFLSGLCVFAQLYLFQPLLPNITSAFHISETESSFLVSSSTIGMALGLLFFGFNADRFTRKQLMSFALITSSILTFTSGFVQNTSVIIVFNIMKGFVLAGIPSVTLAYITEEVDPKIIPLAIGLYLSGNTVGGMTGRIIASLIAEWSSWQTAVKAIGVQSFILAIIFFWQFPESQFFEPKKINFRERKVQLIGFVTDSFFLRLYLIAAIVMGSFVSMYNYLAFRLEQPFFHLPPYLIACIFLMYIFGVVGSMITAKLQEKYFPRQLLRFFAITMAIGTLGLAIKNVPLVIFFLAVFTLSFFACHTLASGMVARNAKEGKSAASSIYFLFYYAGSSLLGSGTGLLLAHGWMAFISVIFIVLLIACLLVKKR